MTYIDCKKVNKLANSEGCAFYFLDVSSLFKLQKHFRLKRVEGAALDWYSTGIDNAKFYFSCFKFKTFLENKTFLEKELLKAGFYKESWSEKSIRKALERRNYLVKEVTLACRSNRGAKNNFFSATIRTREERFKEKYLGWKNVKQVIFNIKNNITP